MSLQDRLANKYPSARRKGGDGMSGDKSKIIDVALAADLERAGIMATQASADAKRAGALWFTAAQYAKAGESDKAWILARKAAVEWAKVKAVTK